MDKLTTGGGNNNNSDDKNNLMEIIQITAMNIQGVSEQMGVLTSQVKNIIARMNNADTRMNEIENRMTYYEDRERVSRDQSRRIRAAIHARVDHLLGIVLKGGLVTKECMSIDKKYRGAFYGRCYTDARKYSALGTPYSETYVKDYETVMNYIEHWEPEVEYEGVTGAKAYRKYLDDRENA